jgi:hypothetical protein
MRLPPLILVALLASCAAPRDGALAPLVTQVSYADLSFEIAWDAAQVSATLTTRGAAPSRRMLIGLAVTVIERATKCIVLETDLPAGSVTVDARIDCTARSVIDL